MGDKRTVATDALATLGTIITEDEKRDAIHLAVENVVAGMRLRAGEHVGLMPDGTAIIYSEPYVGIVDPFLTTDVKKGDRFWLVVYPGQITSLRHVWTHPAFDDKVLAVPSCEGDQKGESEAWLRRRADALGLSYRALIERAEEYLCAGSRYTGGGECEGEMVGREFWDHYRAVTGKEVPVGFDDNFISCSC